MKARLAVPLALSMVGGYVDVVCFVRYSTFVATMTGNLVITGQTFFEFLHSFGGPHEEFRPSPEPIRKHIDGATALLLVGFRSMVMLFNCLGAYGYCALQRRVPHNTVLKAAPVVALLSVMPDVGKSRFIFGLEKGSPLECVGVACLALALGFTHFLCSPAAVGTRLSAVTMAATGHMHGLTKFHCRLANGEKLKQSEWDKYAVSWVVTLGMAFGAILGAAALHLNPFGSETDDWLLVPVALTLFVALRAHDQYLVSPSSIAPSAPAAHASVCVAPGKETTTTTSSAGLEKLREPLMPRV